MCMCASNHWSFLRKHWNSFSYCVISQTWDGTGSWNIVYEKQCGTYASHTFDSNADADLATKRSKEQLQPYYWYIFLEYFGLITTRVNIIPVYRKLLGVVDPSSIKTDTCLNDFVPMRGSWGILQCPIRDRIVRSRKQWKVSKVCDRCLRLSFRSEVGRHFCSTADAPFVKFQDDVKALTPKPANSRLCDFLR